MSKKDIFSFESDRGLGIIQGWKEIGRYIGRSGRTARRWCDQKCLVVRYSAMGRPFAFIYELDLCMSKFSEAMEKHMAENREALCQHTAMMRSCKSKLPCHVPDKAEGKREANKD